ncbi:hypothetical protein COCNU_scaffold006273G000020 [Cocos nucifera]|nr:hypothetical protein [Cocos nucifera]
MEIAAMAMVACGKSQKPRPGAPPTSLTSGLLTLFPDNYHFQSIAMLFFIACFKDFGDGFILMEKREPSIGETPLSSPPTLKAFFAGLSDNDANNELEESKNKNEESEKEDEEVIDKEPEKDPRIDNHTKEDIERGEQFDDYGIHFTEE